MRVALHSWDSRTLIFDRALNKYLSFQSARLRLEAKPPWAAVSRHKGKYCGRLFQHHHSSLHD